MDVVLVGGNGGSGEIVRRLCGSSAERRFFRLGWGVIVEMVRRGVK